MYMYRKRKRDRERKKGKSVKLITITDQMEIEEQLNRQRNVEFLHTCSKILHLLADGMQTAKKWRKPHCVSLCVRPSWAKYRFTFSVAKVNRRSFNELHKLSTAKPTSERKSISHKHFHLSHLHWSKRNIAVTIIRTETTIETWIGRI